MILTFLSYIYPAINKILARSNRVLLHSYRQLDPFVPSSRMITEIRIVEIRFISEILP